MTSYKTLALLLCRHGNNHLTTAFPIPKRAAAWAGKTSVHTRHPFAHAASRATQPQHARCYLPTANHPFTRQTVRRTASGRLAVRRAPPCPSFGGDQGRKKKQVGGENSLCLAGSGSTTALAGLNGRVGTVPPAVSICLFRRGGRAVGGGRAAGKALLVASWRKDSGKDRTAAHPAHFPPPPLSHRMPVAPLPMTTALRTARRRARTPGASDMVAFLCTCAHEQRLQFCPPPPGTLSGATWVAV